MRSGHTLAAIGVTAVLASAFATVRAAAAVPVGGLTLARLDPACWRGAGTAGMWPVAPVTGLHPIRGGFNDARSPATPHFGVDVEAPDTAPVYAVISGVVLGFADIGHGSEHFALGPYRYWHVTPSVAAGSFVRAGQLIGHVYPGLRHVHMTEIEPGCGIVDPRRPGGLLANPGDTERPTIGSLAAFRAAPAAYAPFVPAPFTVVGDPGPTGDPGTRLLLSHLTGVVDFRAPVSDMPLLHTVETQQVPLMATGVRGYIAPAGRPGRRVSRLVTAFDGVRLIPVGSYFSVIAYGTRRINSCLTSTRYVCAASYVIHTAGRGIDTRRLANGHYLYCVQAVTISNVSSRRCTPITVAN